MARIAVDAPAAAAQARHQDQVGRHRAAHRRRRRPVAERATGDCSPITSRQIVRTIYFYNDLFLYDRVTHEQRRLTEGARARNPALSPDGTLVAFEMTGNSSRGLGLLRPTTRCRAAAAPSRRSSPSPTWSTPTRRAGRPTARPSRSRGGAAAASATSISSTSPRAPHPDHQRSRLRPRAALLARRQVALLRQRSHRRLQPLRLRIRHQEALPGDQRRQRRLRSGHLARRQDGRVRRLPRATATISRSRRSIRSSWREADAAAARSPRRRRRRPRSRRGRRTGTTRSARSIRSPGSPTPSPTATARSSASSSPAPTSSGATPGACSSASAPAAPTTCSSRPTTPTRACGPSLNMGVGHSLERRGGLVINGNDIGWDADIWSVGTSIDLPMLRHIVESSDLIFSYDYAWTRNKTPIAGPAIDPSAPMPRAAPRPASTAGFGATWVYSSDAPLPVLDLDGVGALRLALARRRGARLRLDARRVLGVVALQRVGADAVGQPLAAQSRAVRSTTPAASPAAMRGTTTTSSSAAIRSRTC